ncbi:MAG TPA: hypothetical protein VGZ00_05800 [Candidatus Baltobacteraceae bacterium]|jgi:hypothetical protein|nr:hypothetical protein [Candidatus Baltobacteraceae bacterium]
MKYLSIDNATPQMFAFSYEPEDYAYEAWVKAVTRFLTSNFVGKPLWFIADHSMSSMWAFPEDLEANLGECELRIGRTFRQIAYTEACRASWIQSYVESGDFRADSVVILPGTREAASLLPLVLRETADIHCIDYGTITSNVLTSYGDGWGIMWLNHGQNVDDLRGLVEEAESETS